MKFGLVSPINPLSYGIVGWEIFKGLSPEFYFPIGNVDIGSFSSDKGTIDRALMVIKESIDHAREQWRREIPALRLWHEHDLTSLFHCSKKWNGLFTIFEVNKLSQNRITVLSNQDQVFVPSKWAAGICKAHGIDAVVAPLGVDRSVFYPNPGLRQRKFTAVVSGKWEIRKNTQKTIMAFFKALHDQEAELIACVDNPFFNEKDMDSIKQAVGQEIRNTYPNKKATLRFIKRLKTMQEVAALYNRAHIGVQISRAEGFDLPCLEMLSCGCWMIASNNSGHTEYLDRTNAMLLEKRTECIMRDNLWFNGEGGTTWLDSDEDEVAQSIQNFYNDGKWRNTAVLNDAGIRTAEKFSWGQTSRIIEKAIPTN